jgi:5'-3' exonuclease
MTLIIIALSNAEAHRPRRHTSPRAARRSILTMNGIMHRCLPPNAMRLAKTSHQKWQTIMPIVFDLYLTLRIFHIGRPKMVFLSIDISFSAAN